MRKTILTSLLLIVLAVLIFSIYGWNYYDEYNIKPSEESVKTFLEEFDKSKVELLNFEQIENTNIWVAQLEFEEGQFGHAEFQEGWNHHLKFIYLNTNTNLSVTYRDYSTNKGRYGVIFVNNLDKNISKIKVLSPFKDFETEIDTSSIAKTFVKAFKLPKNVENTFPATFYFYDKNGNLYND